MNVKKWMTVLTAGTIALCAVSVPAGIPNAQAESTSSGTVKILCAGDSITDGYSYSQDGYRKYLCYYLQQNGIAYDMVGPQNSWSDSATYNWDGTEITYDPAHCGYSGYAIQQYNGRSGLYETMFGNGNVMETYDPDIILLQIGTNDLLDARLNAISSQSDVTGSTSALERLEGLVDQIIENMDPTDTLFIASVPDIDAEVRYDWLGAYGWFYGLNTSSANDELTETVDQSVDSYNAGVQELVAKKQAEGKNVQFSDIHSVVDKKTGLIDGVHPNETGYAAMGLLWSNIISSYLNASPVVTTTTTTETTTTTTTTETTTSETTTTTTETTTSETTTTTPTETTTSETTSTTIETTTETTTSETESTTTETTSTETETTTTETTTTEAVTTTATSNIPSSIPGDVVPDGRINIFDLAGMKMSLYLPHPDVYPFQGPEDYNQDGSFNMTDIVALAKYLVGAK